jgi:hypothetical protein
MKWAFMKTSKEKKWFVSLRELFFLSR